MNKAKKETAIQISKRTGSSGKTAKQIFDRHVRDKNDVITEEDFNNLDISIANSNDSSHPVLEIPDDPDRPKDEDKDPAVVTPWDIIT